MLIITALVYIIAEIFTPDSKRKYLAGTSIIIFGFVTVMGFIPLSWCCTGLHCTQEAETTLFGGMYVVNDLKITVKNILNLGTLIVLMQSAGYLLKDRNKDRISEYFLLVISTLIGMNFMISSGDFLMFYLGLELATIPIAGLVAYNQFQEKSAEAAVKMILSASLSTGAALFGISLIYGVSGSFYFVDVAANFGTEPIHTLAFVFFFSGLAFKISIVPFHFWTADVYEGAPINVTSYLSVISTGAAVFAVMTILYKVFANNSQMWTSLIYIMAILTMTVGNLFAIRQKNIKRFLAFSSIAQAGFILLGVISGTPLGMASVIFFILVYIFSNLGAFGVVSIINNISNKDEIEDYDGLYRTNPMLNLDS